MKASTTTESGQAALMVTFGITFLLGLLGVVVDVGYGYFMKQVVQASADSAAMAGAVMAQSLGSTCGSTVLCQSGFVCPADPAYPAVTTFDSACLYAKANSTGNPRVTIAAGSGKPPSNTGVSATYWITVTSTQTYPLSSLVPWASIPLR